MADEVDVANEAASRFIALSMANRPTGPRLAPRKQCYNCHEHFKAHSKDADGNELDKDGINLALKLFCDKDCADDFDLYERQKAQRVS